ncbi:chromate transporter [Ferviditalea candida]|uniref:Chromate transporter n=1 Tax=Ferviditalea candida TaxID=3108399 RepID=A0ABU5ZKW5_9BACL|nr:chromate transporter [Paenibacillaceae bacterium T2]
MILWNIFVAFLIANLLGYGGGPASIPLMQQEIVNHYHWLTNAQFADLLAVGNALPGPIATKIAAYVGYAQAGVPGAIAAVIATVAPSAIALIIFLRILNRYRKSSEVRGMTILIQPVIAVLMIMLTWQIGVDSVQSIGVWQFAVIAAVSLLLMTKWKWHPAWIIVIAFVYGGLVLSNTV